MTHAAARGQVPAIWSRRSPARGRQPVAAASQGGYCMRVRGVLVPVGVEGQRGHGRRPRSPIFRRRECGSPRAAAPRARGPRPAARPRCSELSSSQASRRSALSASTPAPGRTTSRCRTCGEGGGSGGSESHLVLRWAQRGCSGIQQQQKAAVVRITVYKNPPGYTKVPTEVPPRHPGGGPLRFNLPDC